MNIWNKILVGLILVASLGFFYMALRTLRTHQHWRVLAQRLETKIQQVQEDNRQLIEGKGEGKEYQPGIDRLRLQLRKMLVDRGRVWTDCKPQLGGQTQQTGLVTLAVDPHGIDPKTPLHVFDAKGIQQGGRYLGEFKVVRVDEANKQVDLQPSVKMTDAELKRLAASAAANTTWIMYEIMPVDTHKAFAGLNEEELKKLLPAAGVEQYIKDGQLLTTEEVEKMGLQGKVMAVDANGRVLYVDQNGRTLYTSVVDDKGRLVYVDDQDHFVCAAAVQKKVEANGQTVYDVQYFDENGQVLPGASVVEKEIKQGKGKYLRRLRDYNVLLTDCYLQRSTLVRRMQNAAEDLAYVKAALADADEQEKFREREKALLTAEKQKAEYERTAVKGWLQKLAGEVKAYQDAVNRLITQNMAVAAQIDKIQQDAERRIDARTGRMAQSGGGGSQVAE
jgi:soluble cytochrome b562